MNLNLSSTSFMYAGILAGLALSLVSGWLAIRWTTRWGLLDMPGKEPHKLHKTPTPLAGGVALMLALPLGVALLGAWQLDKIIWMVAAAAIVFVFGVLDDARAMKPLPKLLGQVLAAVLLIQSGTYIRIFENREFFVGGRGLPFELLDYGLTIFWIVGITNAFNLADSMDGEVAGLSCLAFAFFMLGAYEANQGMLSLLCAILLGICLGLLFYNSSPARLFLGDGAAQTLGFLLAGTAILYNPFNKFPTSSWFVPILLVGVPIFDTTLVFFSRLRRGKPFYKGSSDHTYHRLAKMGLPSSRAVQIIHVAALTLDCLAFIAVSLPPLWANIIFGACLAAGAIAFLYLDRKSICP